MMPPNVSEVLCITALYGCCKEHLCSDVCLFFYFYKTHFYWSTSNPWQHLKSCPPLKESAKWEWQTSFLFTESFFKNRKKFLISFFYPSSSGILELDSTYRLYLGLKGDNISASGRHANPPPTWECHQYVFVRKLPVWDKNNLTY